MSEQDKPVRQVNQRGAARMGAVQALFQMDISGTPLSKVLEEFELYRLGKEIDEELYLPADIAFFRDVVSNVVRDQRKLDPQIDATLKDKWPLARIDTTMRAILRCGAHELNNRSDVPVPVIITEYVEIARAFFENDEPRMVNGVLDALARQIRPDEVRSKAPSSESSEEE